MAVGGRQGRGGESLPLQEVVVEDGKLEWWGRGRNPELVAEHTYAGCLPSLTEDLGEKPNSYFNLPVAKFVISEQNKVNKKRTNKKPFCFYY
jgi:hypothetical protein